MKRWTVRILLCLILGCVTTVAVAWGCAVLRDPWAGEEQIAAVPDWAVYVVTSPGAMRVESDELGGVFPSPPVDPAGLVPSWCPADRSTRRDCQVFDARGWPKLALYCKEDWVYGGDRHIRWGLRTAFEPSGAYDLAGTLPLRPIWPGFLINALFYGVIWFGIFFGFGSARRPIRKRRGRCPKCNYDLRGLPSPSGRRGSEQPGCPECGWGRE